MQRSNTVSDWSELRSGSLHGGLVHNLRVSASSNKRNCSSRVALKMQMNSEAQVEEPLSHSRHQSGR